MNIFKNRKLEVDILTIFLVLIGLYASVVIIFSYVSEVRGIREFSTSTIEQVNSVIEERVKFLLHDLEIPPEISAGIFSRNPSISEKNERLINHFLEVVKYYEPLYSIYAGTPDGGFLAVWDLGAVSLAQDIPPGSAYALSVKENSSTKEKWIYYDEKLERVGSITEITTPYDPRTRPWYQGAVETKKLYWTNVYTYTTPVTKTGITVAVPAYRSNALHGVVGADLALDSFSEFIKNQKIGKTGKAFILDKEGRVIIPQDPIDSISEKVISLAKASGEENQVVDLDGEKYLVALHSFPVVTKQNWQIVVMAPFLDFFAGPVEAQKQIVMISLGILALFSVLVIYSSKRISKPIVILANEVKKIKELNLDSDVRVKSNIREIILLDTSIAAMRSVLRSFSRYAPKEIVKTLMQKGKDTTLGGEKRDITLIFTDITGLTPIAESLPLEELNTLLADYFDGMSKIILKDHGTIDKYIGDSIMAFWDAPDDIPDHAAKGCVAALECQSFVDEFNAKQREQGKPELKTRFGINTGEVIAGNIGTMERMNYTVIGDVVNTTERILQMNKDFHTAVIVGEEVVARVGHQFLFRPLDVATLKGRKGKVQIYELIGKKEEVSQERTELAELFAKAYEAFFQNRLSEAKTLFEEIIRKFPNDYPTQVYLDRIKNQK